MVRQANRRAPSLVSFANAPGRNQVHLVCLPAKRRACSEETAHRRNTSQGLCATAARRSAANVLPAVGQRRTKLNASASASECRAARAAVNSSPMGMLMSLPCRSESSWCASQASSHETSTRRDGQGYSSFPLLRRIHESRQTASLPAFLCSAADTPCLGME